MNRLATESYAVYDVANEKRVNPTILEHIGSRKTISLPPYVQTGIQYIRGAWASSAGVGMDITVRSGQTIEAHYRLIWEPYFFFSRDVANKLKMDRNDFITFKYNLSSKFNSGSKEIQFVQNFSLGYLTRRKGDWFGPTTFKFAMPGLQYKNVLLEPEFVFNKFFREFSPGLKVMVYFE